MKKFFPKILFAILTIGAFFVPISTKLILDENNFSLSLKTNIVYGSIINDTDIIDCYKPKTTFKASATSDSIILDYRIITEKNTTPEIQECVKSIAGQETNLLNEGLIIFWYEKNNPQATWKWKPFSAFGRQFDIGKPENPASDAPPFKIAPWMGFDFKPGVEYIVGLNIVEYGFYPPNLTEDNVVTNSIDYNKKLWEGNDSIIASNPLTIPKDFVLKEVTYEEQVASSTAGGEIEITVSLGCTNLMNFSLPTCLNQLFYAIFSIVSALTELAGKFLDFLIYYSINSSSYKSEFVEKGWAGVRDIANIFFIIALIYVGIKTILGLNVSNNKKLVGMVVVMAMLINFSLFTSRVIIDASNILAKVFYNNIKTTNKDGSGTVNKEGEISISIGLVRNFNPQNLLNNQKEYDENKYIYMGMTVIITIMLGYAIFLFMSVGLLFLGRVASLWIWMIFSPFAFASHAFPFDIPGFGHKEWWPNILKESFMAPLFIFMLYLVVLFTGFLKGIISYSNEGGDWTTRMMGSIIPFIIIFILLMKSKEMAVKYSGELGKKFNDVGKNVAGFALGAATGGAAMLGAGTLGKLAASRLSGAKGEALRERAQQKGLAGWSAKMQLKAANYGSNASFDVRKTPLGMLAAKSGLDLNKSSKIGLGVDKTTGYKGIVERKAKKNEKDFEKFKTTMSDKEVKEWSEKRMDEYNTAREKATDKDLFDREHTKPREYVSAAQLNADRLKTYSDNLGKNDLLYAASYSYAKKSALKNNPQATEKEIEEKAKKIKMVVGGMLKVGVGVATGGIAGSIIGAGMTGAAIGGIAGYSKFNTDEAAKSKYAKEIAKKTEKAEKDAVKIQRLKDRKKKLEEKIKNIQDEVNDTGIGGKNEGGKLKLDDYIEKEIADLDAQVDAIREEQKLIVAEKFKINNKIKNMPKNLPDGSINMERRNLENEIESFAEREREIANMYRRRNDLVDAKNAPEEMAKIDNFIESASHTEKKEEHKSNAGIYKVSKTKEVKQEDHGGHGGGHSDNGNGDAHGHH